MEWPRAITSNTMPRPSKPCDGRFSEGLQAILRQNLSREQWGVHSCDTCGLEVAAKELRGRWVPESHWPSVFCKRKVDVRQITDVRASDVRASDLAIS